MRKKKYGDIVANELNIRPAETVMIHSDCFEYGIDASLQHFIDMYRKKRSADESVVYLHEIAISLSLVIILIYSSLL